MYVPSLIKPSKSVKGRRGLGIVKNDVKIAVYEFKNINPEKSMEKTATRLPNLSSSFKAPKILQKRQKIKYRKKIY